MALADLFTRTKKKINDYFAPAPQVRTRDFVREAPQAIKTTFNDIRTGGLAGLGKRISSTLETGEYFKPVPMQKPSVKNLGTGIRLRDFVRELPTGIGETGNKVAQDAARFAISAYETPGTMKNKQATGKFYDTPVGRLNSYQSEAQNRVNRGDPLWKAIGNPAAEAVLFGAPDVTAIGKSVVKSPIVKAVGKRVLGKTLNNEAKDIVADAGLKVARLARPHIFGKTGSPYRSKLMRSLSRPGGTIIAADPKNGFYPEGSYSSLFDKRAKREISDADAEVLMDLSDGKNFDGRLGGILKHDKLFEEYPWLRGIKTEVSQSGRAGKAGSYIPSENTIMLDAGDAKEVKRGLLHEVQHAIQEDRGFARGGIPDTFVDEALRVADRKTWPLQDELRKVSKLADREVRIFNRRMKMAEQKYGFSSDKYNAYKTKANQWLRSQPGYKSREELSAKIAKMKLDAEMPSFAEGMKKYKRLGGELESRSVERRMDLPQSELTKSDPYSAEAKATGIESVKDVIVRNNGGIVSGAYDGALRVGQPEINPDRDYDNLVARERFNIPALKKISFGGSDRDVYDLGDGLVLKVAKTSRGLTQNGGSSDYYAEGAGLIPKTIEVGKNYIVKEKVFPPDAATKAMVRDIQKLLPFDKRSNEYYTALETLRAKYEDVFPFDDLQNYNILDGDLKAIRNWGTTADGRPIMLDEGTLNGNLVSDALKSSTGGSKNLLDPEFRGIYNQSRTAKKLFGDTDKKTMYSIDDFTPKMWAELNQIAGKAVRTPIDDARYADLESRFYKLSSDDQMQLLGMADVIDDVPMGGLNDEIGNQYDTFMNLFKNPKLRRPEAKNAIMDGDFETLKRELSARGVMSPTEVDNMLYDSEKSSDELLDMFKEQLRADNPELFMGKRIAANLGEVPWKETTVDKKFMSEADAFMEEAKSQAPFGGYLPSGAKDEPLMLPMGRDFTSKEAQRIFKKSGDVVPFKNVLKPAKPMVFGETGADFRRLGIDAKVPTEKVRVDYNYTDPEAPENLSMLRKWITSGERILVKQGTAGKELAKRMQQQRKAEDLLRGSYVTDIKETLKKLHESERMMVTDILEGKEVPKAPQRVTEAAQKMRGFLDEVAEEAQVGGFEIRVPGGKTVPFAKRPNYYPRQYDFDELQRGAMHDRALQHLVETKQARNLAEAEKMLTDFIFANTERRSGNLENARMFDVPGYDRDPLTALQRYASGVAKRFTEAKYFGKKDEMSAALINKIAQNNGDYNEAQRIFDLQVEGLPKNDVVGAITKYNVATKLDLAFITNATQSLNTITKAGLINTIMGAARGFTKKGRRFAEEVGAVQDSHIYEREVGKFNSIAKAVMIPFRIVENFNRRTAANTGLIRTKELYERAQGGSRYAIRELKSLGIDPTKKSLTDQDLLGAAYEMTRKTQFKVDSLDIPPAWKTPLGRLVTQFKSFSFAQTKFVRDEILKEFVKGNPMPLLRFVPLAIGASMSSQYIRNMLTGRDPQDDTKNTDIRQWDKWLKGFGTIPTDLIIQGKFLKDTYDSEYLTAMRKLSRVLGSTLGVTAGTATSWMAAIESISSTEAKNKLLGVEKEKQDPYLDLKRQATGDIPIVGEYAKNKLFPYKKSDKTEEEKAQTKAYFDTKERVMSGMTTKERAALDSLPTTNPLNPWAKIQKYTTYRTSPAVFEAKRQLALTAEKGDMEKIDPLFRYEYESVKPYLAYQSMLPNARERKALREKFPIIMQLGKERSDFFDANPIDPEFAQPDIKGLAPYPEVDAETGKLMDAKNWKHPKVQAYFDARDAWESQVYALAGVPLTQDGFGFGGGGKGKKPPKPQYRDLPFEDLEDFISKRNMDVSPKAQFGVGVPISKPSFSMPTRSQIATRKASLRKRKPITVSFRGRQAV